MGNTLYIIRGVAGAGKTTFADALSRATKASWHETDMFFLDEEGSYKWDANKLSYYHRRCQLGVENSMILKLDVIVSNTFTTEKELQPYLELACKYGYNVVSLIVENRSNTESVHNVPTESVKKMVDRFSVKLISDKMQKEIDNVNT